MRILILFFFYMRINGFHRISQAISCHKNTHFHQNKETRGIRSKINLVEVRMTSVTLESPEFQQKTVRFSVYFFLTVRLHSQFVIYFLLFLYFSPGEVSREAGGSLTSLLVQPISAFLAKTLLSSSSAGQGDSCVPLSMPPNAGEYTEYSVMELLHQTWITNRPNIRNYYCVRD